ncbi:hypothetical protein [Vampirovibrio sp.]|uniref:hypothetical protein n=1 Tax=Vampirovibrio sp. TaxID=2717857 RepID=UPI00359454D6
MKTTFVLSLDEDTAVFIEQMREHLGNEDPNTYINRLLRQERDRSGMPARQSTQSVENHEMEKFIDQQIPSAG